MNQCAMILDYMRAHGGITPLDAANELGIQRLGARVWDLKHKHEYNIKTERVHVKNRRGETCSVAKYSLEE